MADMGPTISAVDQYGDERYAEGLRDGIADGLAQRQPEVDALQQEVGTLTAKVGELRSLIDQHMATHAATAKTQYGACPNAGSNPVAKYGEGASVRWFDGGAGLSKVPTRPAGCSRLHASWKTTLGTPVTDAQLVAAFGNLKDGDIVEVWHETDVKYRKGQDLAAMLGAKNQFHDRVVALRDAGRIPKVLTCNTWAGWSVDSTSSVNPANLHCRADLLGNDMDGIPAKDTFYPFAARQLGEKFVTAFKDGGYKGWTIPEFCMAAVDSDPDRTKRTAWFKAEVAKISQGVPAAGIPAPLMIAWFDTGGPLAPYEDNGLTKPNEIAAWSELVATNG